MQAQTLAVLQATETQNFSHVGLSLDASTHSLETTLVSVQEDRNSGHSARKFLTFQENIFCCPKLDNFGFIVYNVIRVVAMLHGSVWGVLRAPSGTDTASKTSGSNLAIGKRTLEREDRALVATGSVRRD